MDIYAHVIPGMQAEAADMFRNLVFGDDEPEPHDPEPASQDDSDTLGR